MSLADRLLCFIQWCFFNLFLSEPREEIAYLMECADTNNDGLLDYTEFTERFHQPAENIGTLTSVYTCILQSSTPQFIPMKYTF